MRRPGRRKSEYQDLELTCLVSGVLLIACFVICLLDASAAPVFVAVITGLGVILNSAAAMLKFIRKRKAAGIVLAAFSLSLLALFFLQIHVLRGGR